MPIERVCLQRGVRGEVAVVVTTEAAVRHPTTWHSASLVH